MTLAGAGADAISANVSRAFAVSADGSIPGRAELDQATAETLLKEEMQGSGGWNGASLAAFGGLKFDNMPLVLNIVASVLDTVVDVASFGFIDLDGFWNGLGDMPIFDWRIPGLDASKIISGEFAMELVEGLTDFVGMATDFIENIVGEIVQAITGTIGTLSNLATWFLDIPKMVGGLLSSINIPILDPSKILNLPGLFSNVSGMLTGVATGVIGGFTGAVGAFLNALFGVGSAAIPAYGPTNSGTSNVQAQINAILAVIGTDVPYDGFNSGPSLSNDWARIFGDGNVITEGGYVFSPTDFNCYRYNARRPTTKFWQVQASLAFHPGVGQGICRVFGNANTGLTNRYVAVEYGPPDSQDWIRIVTLEGAPDSNANASRGRVMRKEVFFPLFQRKTGDVIALECDEDYYGDGSNVALYSAYINPGPGTGPIVTWLDDTGIVPRGDALRYGGIQLNVFHDGGFPGAGFDNFSIFDRQR